MLTQFIGRLFSIRRAYKMFLLVSGAFCRWFIGNYIPGSCYNGTKTNNGNSPKRAVTIDKAPNYTPYIIPVCIWAINFSRE